MKMMMTMFGYLILISIHFTILFVRFLLSFSSIEKIYQTLKTVFDQVTKHLEVRQKYSATRRIFNSLLGVYRRGQTRSIVFQ